MHSAPASPTPQPGLFLDPELQKLYESWTQEHYPLWTTVRTPSPPPPQVQQQLEPLPGYIPDAVLNPVETDAFWSQLEKDLEGVFPECASMPQDQQQQMLSTSFPPTVDLSSRPSSSNSDESSSSNKIRKGLEASPRQQQQREQEAYLKQCLMPAQALCAEGERAAGEQQGEDREAQTLWRQQVGVVSCQFLEPRETVDNFIVRPSRGLRRDEEGEEDTYCPISGRKPYDDSTVSRVVPHSSHTTCASTFQEYTSISFQRPDLLAGQEARYLTDDARLARDTRRQVLYRTEGVQGQLFKSYWT